MREFEFRKGLKKHTVVLYDDIDQLPIERFNKANKYWMLHDNLGSSFTDIDTTHISRLILVADNKEKVVKELENLRILIYNIINEVNPSQMAFACLVDSIDGKEITDISEEGIKRTLKLLSDIGFSEALKKKVN
jgi:aspartyl-tRNA synthetase